MTNSFNFPKDFLWGGAVAANQCEGGYNLGGRGLSVLDTLTSGSHEIKRQQIYPLQDGVFYPNHQGIDFYHRYKEDIKLLAEANFKCFRFSMSWSRIFPHGDDEAPNQEGLDFYHNVISECRKYGIEPLVTIDHFEFPIHLLEKYGGWKTRDVNKHFVKYMKTVFDEYHDDVKYWLTINEINANIANEMHFPDMNIAGLSILGINNSTIQERIQGMHYQFVAAAEGVKYAHDTYPDLKIGCMVTCMAVFPLTSDPADMLNYQQRVQWLDFIAGDVMVKGEYPYYAMKRFKDHGIDLDCTSEDLNIIKHGTVDFLSFSYYGSNCVTTHRDVSKYNGQRIPNPYLKMNKWGHAPDAFGLRFYANMWYDRYKKPIFIVENGTSRIEELNDYQTVDDDYRISFLNDNIKAIGEAINDGVDIIGYTMWSPFDLISASSGEMRKRYGLIYVDRNDDGSGTYQRYPKKSYYWYRDLIASNGKNLK